MNMLGFVWRHCHMLSTFSLKTLYCSLVRSHLEYCSPIWFPFYKTDNDYLERIQKKFLRCLEFRMHWPHHKGQYEIITNFINLPSLHTRRILSDGCLLHGVINAHIVSPEILSQLDFYVPDPSVCNTRSVNIFRVHSSLKTNFAFNNPINRLMELGNKFASIEKFDLFQNSKHIFRREFLSILNNNCR